MFYPATLTSAYQIREIPFYVWQLFFVTILLDTKTFYRISIIISFKVTELRIVENEYFLLCDWPCIEMTWIRVSNALVRLQTSNKGIKLSDVAFYFIHRVRKTFIQRMQSAFEYFIESIIILFDLLKLY